MASTVFYPMIRDWQITFDPLMSADDISSFMNEFVKFHCNPRIYRFEAPVIGLLSGRVYGRPGFSDGEFIKSSSIKTIEKVEVQYTEQNPSVNGNSKMITKDFYLATTSSDSKYYFLPEEMNGLMTILTRFYAPDPEK